MQAEAAERPVWSSRAWSLALCAIGALAVLASLVGIDGPEQAWMPLTVFSAIVTGILAVTLWRVRHRRAEHEHRLTNWAAQQAAQEERLRIARELHDLASHGLGLITLRAASAVRSDDSDEREAALRDIERASRGAMTELRRMLTVLRSPAEPGAGSAPLLPLETLEDLPALIETARTAGLRVHADLPEPAQFADISPGVQLAVCAIVREALTNTARHAGPTEVSVALRRGGAGTVIVEIEDQGLAPGWVPSPGAGLGLPGIRERVASLGGALETGATPRGYRVLVTLRDEIAS